MRAYLYAALAALILILCVLVGVEHHGKLTAQNDLLAYKSAQAQAVADAVNAAHIKEQAAETNNATILKDLQGKLDQSVADGNLLAARLRLARARHDACPLPQAPDQPQPVSPSGKPGSDQAFEAAAWSACERDGSRLDALIEQVTPQL